MENGLSRSHQDVFVTGMFQVEVALSPLPSYAGKAGMACKARWDFLSKEFQLQVSVKPQLSPASRDATWQGRTGESTESSAIISLTKGLVRSLGVIFLSRLKQETI